MEWPIQHVLSIKFNHGGTAVRWFLKNELYLFDLWLLLRHSLKKKDLIQTSAMKLPCPQKQTNKQTNKQTIITARITTTTTHWWNNVHCFKEYAAHAPVSNKQFLWAGLKSYPSWKQAVSISLHFIETIKFVQMYFYPKPIMCCFV